MIITYTFLSPVDFAHSPVDLATHRSTWPTHRSTWLTHRLTCPLTGRLAHSPVDLALEDEVGPGARQRAGAADVGGEGDADAQAHAQIVEASVLLAVTSLT